MISIIICSRSKELLNAVSKNVSETVDVSYEIISVDNSSNQYSLCQAYNIGADKASYHILCFMHEDIAIRTKNWGNIVTTILQQGYELIGVAGSSYKSKFVSGWATGNPKFDFYNIYHKDDKSVSHYYSDNFDSAIKQCVVLDGVWLCCTKTLWQKVKFNETLLKGFHFYDIDFSMRCNLIAKVCVTASINIEHYSQGRFGNEWMKAALVFHSHYKNILPVMLDKQSGKILLRTEKNIYLFWLKRLKKEPLSIFYRILLQWYAFRYMPKTVMSKLLKR